MNQDRRPSTLAEREALEARFSLRVTGRLAEHAESSRNDVSERLRIAREQALARARAARAAARPAGSLTSQRGGTAVLGGAPGEGGLWFKVATLIPILALLLGFMLIQKRQQHVQIVAAADVDAELLADDLPPAAYLDPGFAEYLKSAPGPNPN